MVPSITCARRSASRSPSPPCGATGSRPSSRNAALSVAVVGYFISVFPAATAIPPSVLTVAFMWLFVGVNLLGVKSGGRVQVITSLLKVVPLLLVMVLGGAAILVEPADLHREPAHDAAGRAAAVDGCRGDRALCDARLRVGDHCRGPRPRSRAYDPPRNADRHAVRRDRLRRDRRHRNAARAAGDAR